MIQFFHQVHISRHLLSIDRLITIVIILKTLQQNNTSGILIPKQGNGAVHTLLQITEANNISKGFNGIQDTIGTGECLYQTVHLQILIHPQRIHSCGVKTCKEHIYYDQDIQFLILHTKRHIFIVILKLFAGGIIACMEHFIIVLDCIFQKISGRLIKSGSILRIFLI